MNSASTQIAVAPTTQTASPTSPSPSSGQISQKDFLEEPLPRQNSLGGSGSNRHRGGGAKGKHLTRSHAMRESTSPPRTPTPRSDLLTSTASSPMTSSVNTSVSQACGDIAPATSSESRLHVQSSATSTSPTSGSPSPNLLDTPSVIVTQQSQQQSQTSPPIIFSTDDGGRSQLDVDFPKLTPPKSKSPRNMGDNNKSNVAQQTSPKAPTSNHTNSGTNTETIAIPNHHHHHHHRHPNNSPGNVSPCSQHSSNGGGCAAINVVDTSPIPSPQGTHSYEKEGGGRSMREGQCNYEGEGESPPDGPGGGRGNAERGGGKKHRNGPSAKDNSSEQYTDQSGVDLIQFFKETLNKNLKDRTMLLRIEKELLALVYDRSRTQIKFPPASSYNRMLIHRTAAYFGMDHNVDATQTCVIAEVTKNTRVPEIRFESLIREMDEPRKSILKRDSHSFDEYRQGLLPCPDRGMLDRKSKSFEEREEEYERARRRIFKDRDGGGGDYSIEEQQWPWSSSESSENSGRHKMAQNNRLLKVQSLSVDTRGDGRPCVSKSHSFGGYGGPMQSTGSQGHHLSRGDSVTSTKSAGPRLFPKQDSVGSTNTPWRCSPSSSGSLYLFDPSNLPPGNLHNNNNNNIMIKPPTHVPRSKKYDKTKTSMRNNENCDGNESNSLTHSVIMENQTTNSSNEDLTSPQIDEDDVNARQSESPVQQHQVDEMKMSPQKMQKSQATSPNIPTQEVILQAVAVNEVDTVKVHHQQHPRQEDTSLAKSSVVPSVIPVMGYTTTTGYPAMENGAMFPAPNAPFPTYQQGPDGSVYAVPPMVYAYPPPMESEMSGYFLPMYDQAGTPRDTGLMPAPTPTAALYQPAAAAAAAAAATVVPMTPYAPTAYSSGPLYTQGQVVYTAATDQFGSPAAAAATPQYPIPAYPTMTYPYPTYNGTTTYQGYWGQPMATTYYVPQPQLVPHPAPTANGTVGGSSKRGSPPQNTTQQSHGSNPSTPQTTTFNNPFGSAGVPVAAAGDPATMYALPQPVYPNMLPYASPATVPGPASAAVPHLPHHPHAHHGGSDGVKIRYGVMSTSQSQPAPQAHQNPIHSDSTQSSYNAQSSGTPQSAPSTPLSLPLPLPTGHMSKGGPPIFPTPPIMTNGFGPQFPGSVASGENGYSGSYERKNNANGSGQQTGQHSNQQNGRRNNNNNSGAPGSGGRSGQNSFGGPHMSQQTNTTHSAGPRKNLSHDNTQGNVTQNRPANSGPFQKPRNGGEGGPGPKGGSVHSGPVTSGTGANTMSQSSVDKVTTPRGPRPKPANLDLRRSNSQRNTPSTNSTESNNSPNSIASSEHQPVYMTRGTHNPPLAHHPATATAMGIDPTACHQPLIGAAYNPAAGMYVKFGQTYFTHPTMGLTSNRRSPPSDVRPPPLTPIAPGMYPMNMMLPGNKYFMRPNESEWMAKKWSCVSKIAPRHLGPRPTHSGGYKGGNKGGGHPPAGVAASATPR
ncbi:protein encore isoform X9 [Phlebotomus papatasi]|uniref:protein encore isoform X9 n=1 Tax=Phlebotomus papatasi TaxID=29031 RepID=UPI002483C47D|nr:protein encore isoform X9 [Phlebotomus papatasi]